MALQPDGVEIRGVPLHTAYPRAAHEGRVPVLFEIDVKSPNVQERTPFELCIVLDISGSMAGGKMRDAKAAVYHAIDTLSDGDMLHLVAFNDVATTVFSKGTSERAAELREAIASISAGGATNTSAALSRAQDILIQSGENAGSKRIFLISDGHASCGVRTADGLCAIAHEAKECGMAITTFGIGEDINEELMKGIANRGRGSYFFLRETIMKETIQQEMTCLLTTIGTDAIIHVEALSPVGQLLRVHRPADDESSRGDLPGGSSGNMVWIGDLRSGSYKQSLIECSLHVPDSAQDGDLVGLVQFEMRYKSAARLEEACATGVVHVLVGNDGAEVSVVKVADAMIRIGSRQEELRRLIQSGAQSDAHRVRDSIFQDLEALLPFDMHGYAQANIRRLRRIAERLDTGVVSNERAGLMLGEALESQATGDRMRADSFASFAGPTYPAHYDQVLSGDSSFATFPGDVPARRRKRDVCWSVLHKALPCFVPPPPHVAIYDAPVPPQTSSQAVARQSQPPPPQAVNLLHYLTRQRGLGERGVTPDVISFSAAIYEADSAPTCPLQPPSFLLAPGFNLQSLPPEFLCPITHEPMTDPVVAQDGHTYERVAIAQWFADHQTSPKTGASLLDKTLTPNHALRAQIVTENDRLQAATPN
jgi:Mg-chelatase subunit ChlD